MALTAAERAKRYREKLKQNPEKFEEQRKKQLKRLQKNRKKINDLTEEDKERRRKAWREEKKKQKLKKKREEDTATPSSPKPETSQYLGLKIRYKKICRNYRAALANIRKQKSKHESIRKKLYRVKLAHEAEVCELQTKIDKLTARQEVLELSLRETYGTAHSLPAKRLLKSIAINQVVKTNRSVKAVATCLGLKGRIRQSKKKTVLNKKIQEEIKHFYMRDDISRNTAGKRETRTRGKKKMQIRYLTDTLQNVYEVYKKEGGTHSFTTFFRYKPYYILSPTAKNRDTCMCIKHSNMEYLFIALKTRNVIGYKNLEECIKQSVCDKNLYDCMYDTCENCNNRRLQYNEEKLKDEIRWFKWERVSHTYQKNEKNVTTKKTIKQLKTGKVKDVVEQFEAEFSKFKRHCYNWKEQQRQYKICVNGLTAKEIAILVDFSENYECKLGAEIQSMHFGASKNSITLHCGIVYSNDKSQSFVSVSDNMCHEPNAIWAHLLPILQFVKKAFPTIEIVHFFSDGPTSQYRQKKNFFLINLFATKLKLKYLTWSFSESGHGKGVADGIGGAVKRHLDRWVAYGHDLANADDAYQHLSTSMKSVKCFQICNNDIENLNNIIPKDLKAVPETMKIHQIISLDEGQIRFRQLSCFCGEKRGLCECLSPKTHIFHSEQNKKDVPTVLTLGREMKPSLKNHGGLTVSVTDTVPCIMNDNVELTVAIVGSENMSADKTGRQIATFTDVAHCSKSDSSYLSVEDFAISCRKKDSQADFNMTPDLKIDNILDLDVFENIVEYPQTGYDLISDCLKKDDVECLSVEGLMEGKENENKRLLHAADVGPAKKKMKVHLPIKKEEYKSRSLKIITNRNFKCHMCKLRKLYVIRDMTKCIACKNWVCRACCDQPAIDFICDTCLEGD